ncbi:tetratricopeptide repeat protein [Sneathiella chinensis]|uniref:tetratricopeptide repeat protein n=1 Tax=Sneathiella chinensis TaxID=349750 RepID=UPI00146B9833|nr:hypothetical protein [Sneathiella chinensis]
MANARQDDNRLDPLFEKLTNATSVSEGKDIERAIWEIWLVSGNDAVDSLMTQGIMYLSLGQLPQALFFFTAITEMDPGFAEAWNKRAMVLFIMGDLNGSLKDVGRTLELEPRHFGAMAGLGQIMESKRAYKKALAAFEQAIRVNPHMTEVQKRVRRLRLEYGDRKI